MTFAKELIRHSEKKDIIKLQKIIETEEVSRGKVLQKPIPIFTRETKEIQIPSKQPVIKKIEKPLQQKPPVRQFTKPLPKPLFIPEPKLPEHLEYLKPIPTSGLK